MIVYSSRAVQSKGQRSTRVFTGSGCFLLSGIFVRLHSLSTAPVSVSHYSCKVAEPCASASFFLIPPYPCISSNSLVEWSLQVLALLLQHGRPYGELLKKRGIFLAETGATPVFGSVPRPVEVNAEMDPGYNAHRRCCLNQQYT